MPGEVGKSKTDAPACLRCIVWFYSVGEIDDRQGEDERKNGELVQHVRLKGHSDILDSCLAMPCRGYGLDWIGLQARIQRQTEARGEVPPRHPDAPSK